MMQRVPLRVNEEEKTPAKERVQKELGRQENQVRRADAMNAEACIMSGNAL